jgi:RNA polymerase sigma factor (sigma-70 family)
MRDDPVVTDLVTKAANGDRQAWDALVDRYAPLIWSICRRHRLDNADAEDVGQAVWLHLVEHLGSLRDPAALPGWLTTTTRRECCRVRRAARHLRDDGDVLEKMPDEQTATAEHELVAAERNAVIREAFARLPQGDQRLLALLLADPPVRYTEISARLGIPVGSIGPNRRRSLNKLRCDPAITRLISAQTAGSGPGSRISMPTPIRRLRDLPLNPPATGNSHGATRDDAAVTAPG